MSNPAISITTRADVTAETTRIPRKFVARLLGLAPATLAKGIHSGVIPEITAGNLSALVTVPVLTSARLTLGQDLPILRTGAQAPSSWDPVPGRPPRAFMGYGATMTDSQALDATLRWWTRVGSAQVLSAGALLVVVGGWSVMLLAIAGITKELPGERNCLFYDGTLIARCESVIDQRNRIVDHAHPLTPHVDSLLGRRVLGGEGGSITRLAGHE